MAAMTQFGGKAHRYSKSSRKTASRQNAAFAVCYLADRHQ